MPDAARQLAGAILDRHAGAVRVILFYGSCLRRQSAEGVLDFYALVERARDVYGARPATALASLLPPNVHYLECDDARGGPRLRAKYAVLTLAAFERLCGQRARHPFVWARFAQPARLVLAADATSRERATRACAEAALTLVRRLVAFQPEHFAAADFWREAFTRTYGTELRSESAERREEIQRAEPARYEAVLAAALDALVEERWLEAGGAAGGTARAVLAPLRRRRARWSWTAARPFVRALALARLLKTPLTFEGWPRYVLWKLERHTGQRFEPTETQLRHPWIFGWPLLFRLLLRRDLR
jgi:hypothetical protein